jgi:hypothetical protein
MLRRRLRRSGRAYRTRLPLFVVNGVRVRRRA